MQPIYPRNVNLTPELEAIWQRHKLKHPEESFSGFVKKLIQKETHALPQSQE